MDLLHCCHFVLLSYCRTNCLGGAELINIGNQKGPLVCRFFSLPVCLLCSGLNWLSTLSFHKSWIHTFNCHSSESWGHARLSSPNRTPVLYVERPLLNACYCCLCCSNRNDLNAVTVLSRDYRGYTALHIAAQGGTTAFRRLKRFVLNCVRIGLTEVMSLLIERQSQVNAADFHGSTPLHIACQRGNQKAVVLCG